MPIVVYPIHARISHDPDFANTVAIVCARSDNGEILKYDRCSAHDVELAILELEDFFSNEYDCSPLYYPDGSVRAVFVKCLCNSQEMFAFAKYVSSEAKRILDPKGES